MISELTVVGVMKLIKDHPGITNKQVAIHFGVKDQSARHWMMNNIDEKEHKVFKQINRGSKAYYLRSYADKHRLVSVIKSGQDDTSRNDGIMAEIERHLDLAKKLDILWIVPKGSE